LEENRRAPAFPLEDGAKRLEVRDPETLGRKAWGYLSRDERFILSDRGHLWLRVTKRELRLNMDNLNDESSTLWIMSSRLHSYMQKPSFFVFHSNEFGED